MSRCNASSSYGVHMAGYFDLKYYVRWAIFFGPYRGPAGFRPRSKLLLSPMGNKVRLTEKETSILRYLYRAGQRPVSRETLLREVWGYNSGVPRTRSRRTSIDYGKR